MQPRIHDSLKSVVMLNKDIPNNEVKETGTPREGILPGILGMREQVPGDHNQATTPLNVDNEHNVMVLGEEE